MDPAVSVVVITRDRAELLATTLDRLVALPERPAVIVVDNGSGDGTPAMVRHRFPQVTVVALPVNRGSAARQVGARLATTPYVAFADDDSWWAPGALAAAAGYLDQHPAVAVVAARVLVGVDQRLDPTSAVMAASALGPASGRRGRAILGFLACAAVVRREAFLHVGGFPERFGVGGEEEPLAMALAAEGWELVYLDDVVAHHHPAPARDPTARRRVQARNRLWAAWLARSPAAATRATLAAVAGARHDAALRRALVDAARGVGWVYRERKPVPPGVERALRLLEAAGSRRPTAGQGGLDRRTIRRTSR